MRVCTSDQEMDFATFSHPNIETFGENLGVLLNEVFGVNADKSGYFSFLKDTVKKIPKRKGRGKI